MRLDQELYTSHALNFPTETETQTSEPKTYKEMFEHSESDNVVQRLFKWYLKPRGNPHTTIKILKALQIHQFQKIPRILARHMTSNGKYRYQSTYSVKDTRLSSLIDYGTNQTAFNEIWHLGAIAVTNLPTCIADIMNGNMFGLTIIGSVGVLNLYCVLAQRYSRARCEVLIDRALSRGRTIEFYEYSNRFNLKLPK
ncbi:MAG: hypothetical protein WCV81_02780 [Microgenomates group bacterium]|jgi:hypothetical protein